MLSQHYKRPKKGKELDEGFTMIEIVLTILLISILTGVTASLMRSGLDGQKYEQTRNQMDAIRVAIIGDTAVDNLGHRVNFGYSGDWGSLPAALSSLSAAQVPAYAYDTYYGVGVGWRGPYLSVPMTGQNAVNDAWGNAIVTNTTGNPAIWTSYGADGAAGGTLYNTDLVLNISLNQWQSSVYGNLLGSTNLPVSGGTMEIRYPVNGTLTAFTTTTDANGYYKFTGVPMGVRALSALSPTLVGPRLITVDQSNYIVPPTFLTPIPVPTPILQLDASKYNGVGFTAIGCAPADLTWDDLSGNGYNGTLTSFSNPCAAGGDGWQGAGTVVSPYKLTFDGTNDYVNSIHVPTAGISDWTEIAWVNIPNSAAGKAAGVVFSNRLLVTELSNTLDVGWWAGAASNNGFVYFSMDGPGCEFGAVGTQNIADAKWHHITGTRVSGSGTYTVYVDDQQQGQNNSNVGGACGGSSASSPEVWTVGYSGAWTPFFDGSIAYLAVYNQALSQAEITTDCNARVANYTGAICH